MIEINIVFNAVYILQIISDKILMHIASAITGKPRVHLYCITNCVVI